MQIFAIHRKSPSLADYTSRGSMNRITGRRQSRRRFRAAGILDRDEGGDPETACIGERRTLDQEAGGGDAITPQRKPNRALLAPPLSGSPGSPSIGMEDKSAKYLLALSEKYITQLCSITNGQIGLVLHLKFWSTRVP
jgi:hypothetical protein